MADVAFTVSTFKATGTPTARTIPDRLAEIANVKDFGAKGDGVTDDLPAIMAAYNHWQVTLVATAPSVGNTITFASVPATITSRMFATDVTNPSALTESGAFVVSITGTTVTLRSIVEGAVHAGDVLTFNIFNKGKIYFPPGTYYISAPIDVSPAEDGSGQVYFQFIGELGASTIVGDFADYIIKRGLSTNGNSWGGAGHIVEKLTLINRNANGGGIRMGACVGAAIRDCDITANFGINTVNSDTEFTDGVNTFFSGSLEVTIDNCNLRAYNALAYNKLHLQEFRYRSTKLRRSRWHVLPRMLFRDQQLRICK
jgi:hypothetical protein